MFSRPGRGAGLLALALLAATLLAPLAASDHAYSHRYIIYGRVVDANGDPVPGLTVRLSLQELETEGNCANQPGTDTDAFGITTSRPVTNQFGEFTFCSHVHVMYRPEPGRALFDIPEANFSEEVTLDPYYRTSFVPLKLPTVREDANKTAAQTSYTVLGRLWREGSARTHVESIRVFGDTVDNAPVNVTLEADGQTTRLNTTTNNYGDFAIRIPVAARPTSGKVIVEAEGRTYEQSIDPAVGATAFKIEVPADTTFGIRSDIVYAVLGVLGAAAVVVLAVVGFRKAAARREAEAVRASSQRKRANK